MNPDWLKRNLLTVQNKSAFSVEYFILVTNSSKLIFLSGTNMQVESTSKPMLTVDEANEDTISAFEETDATVDLRIKNSVCLVIDLEGFISSA